MSVTYRIIMTVTPGSYLTQPIARWLRKYGAESVTVNDDDTQLVAEFLTPLEQGIAADIISNDPTRLFREITFGENISLIDLILRP